MLHLLVLRKRWEPGANVLHKRFQLRARTIQLETPENIVNADASKPTTLKKFVKQTGLKKGDIDVIIGGPPCQGFSSVGRIQIAELVKKGIRKGRSTNPRFISDPRNNLYKSFVKFVDFYKPKFLIMENVQGMMSYRDGWAVEQIKEDLKDVGYKNVQEKVLNAVLTLMDNIDQIEIFNKKAVYLYMREITGLNTKQIVTNLNKMRAKYKVFRQKWNNGEVK